MRGLADKMLRLERVNVSLFISLPHGGSLGRPLALCPRRRFRAGFILKSPCCAIPAACSLNELEEASQFSCWVGKGEKLPRAITNGGGAY